MWQNSGISLPKLVTRIFSYWFERNEMRLLRHEKYVSNAKSFSEISVKLFRL